MPIPNDVVDMLNAELAWAQEDGSTPIDQLPLAWQPIEDWSKVDLTGLVDPPPFAIRIDTKVLFGSDLQSLRTPGSLKQRNPRYVSFRSLGRPGHNYREAMILIRANLCPGESDMVELAHKLHRAGGAV